MTQNSLVNNPWKLFFATAAEFIAKAASAKHDVVERFMEIPPDSKLGDVASTISFHLAKELKRNPVQIAKDIVLQAESLLGEFSLIERIENKGPYINLFFSRPEYIRLTLASVNAMGADYGKTDEFDRKRALIEFPAVNPSKPWHIGHTRNAVLGDTLGNVLSASGWEVLRLDYVNDLGLQIAQLTWKLSKEKHDEIEEKYDHYLGRLYVTAQDAFENDSKTNAEVRETSRRLEDLNSMESQTSLKMVTRCLKAQNQTAYRLGIFHDYQVWESAIAHSGLLDTAKEMMLEADNIVLLEDGDKAGCIVARLDTIDEFKDMQDPNKVLFRSDGTRTYTGADVALQMWKFGILKDPFKYTIFDRQPNGQDVYRTSLAGEERQLGRFDAVFNVIGSEQAHPQRLIYAILDLLGFREQSENSHHISYEFVGLEEGEFSGRKGTWIGYSTDGILDRARGLAYEEVAKRNPDESEEFKERVAEQVGSGAVRYFLLNASPDRKITFRWEEALDFNGDAAPYLQYSHARAARILEKAADGVASNADLSLLKHEAEFELGKMIARFPQEIVDTAKGLKKSTWGTGFQSNRLTTYCYGLATAFSKFYDNCPVLKEKPHLKAARLELVGSFKTTISNCLRLLGIPVVERM
jgi:arginyl-tRNA synthetase